VTTTKPGIQCGGQCVDPQTGDLIVKFNPVYSAYEASHTYAVPIAVNAMNATLTASDPTAVGIQQNADLSMNGLTGWTLTMLKAPTSPVTLEVQVQDVADTGADTTIADGGSDVEETGADATVDAADAGGAVGNRCTATQLFVTSVTSNDWQIGYQRYNTGASLHLKGDPDGSILETADGGPACTSCHGITATSGFLNDATHTPEQTGGYSDDDLIGIIVHGVVPDGGYFDPNILSMMSFHAIHQWTDIMPDQYKGMVAYLRSLTPMALPGINLLGGFAQGGPGDAGGGG
jgi:hypothetical protein